jgi:hypothetical protein
MALDQTDAKNPFAVCREHDVIFIHVLAPNFTGFCAKISPVFDLP